MNILLVEPYCGGSHRAWAEGYARHSGHTVSLLRLPARFWKWRMQGGCVSMAERARALDHRPDCVLASDMLNLPGFLALSRDLLADVPAAIYFHENQLTYPFPPGERRDLAYAMINWLSMLAADRVFFNSSYHMEDWFRALPNMLKHFPDHTHLHRIDEVRHKAEVLPVGCELERLDAVPRRDAPGESPLILWNQRWEYDKDPGTFFEALRVLKASGDPFRLAVAGRSYRQTAPEFEAARAEFSDRVLHFGYAPRDDYHALLRQADIVVSTAIHEFFGVAVVEAIYAGCFPVLPNRLSYPDLVPGSHHDACLYDSFDDLVDRLRWALTYARKAASLARDLRPAAARFDWRAMAPRYDWRLEDIA
jgi:glycosyltransferase involved in cell wall biosynthesis